MSPSNEYVEINSGQGRVVLSPLPGVAQVFTYCARRKYCGHGSGRSENLLAMAASGLAGGTEGVAAASSQTRRSGSPQTACKKAATLAKRDTSSPGGRLFMPLITLIATGAARFASATLARGRRQRPRRKQGGELVNRRNGASVGAGAPGAMPDATPWRVADRIKRRSAALCGARDFLARSIFAVRKNDMVGADQGRGQTTCRQQRCS